VVQSKFTSKDLFDAVYARKIMEDFQSGKLDQEGKPLEPSDYETLTAEEAKVKARKTGSDMF
jgi:large subunit ribosomal protein L41